MKRVLRYLLICGLTGLIGASVFAADLPATPTTTSATPMTGTKRIKPKISLSGTVKDLAIPVIDNKGKISKQSVSFTLVSDLESVTVVLGPASYLAKIGLALKEGDAVTVTGWRKKNAKKAPYLNVCDLTLAGQTYPFRDASGADAWMPKVERVMALTGTVKNLVIPETATNKRGKALPETFTLTGENLPLTTVLGPVTALAKLPPAGLTVKEGDAVTISGWKITDGQTVTLLVGAITVNGVSYTLRTAENKEVWAPVTKQVTLEGTVKNLTVPTAPVNARKRNRKPQSVSFTLVTNAQSIFTKLAPADALVKLGISFKEGDTITVSGALVTENAVSTLTARAIIINGTTYTLRDDKGKAAWNTPAPTPTILPAPANIVK
jgi:hypothetical protein